MKNKNNLKIQLGAAALGVLATTALVAGVTYAQSNSETKGNCEFNKERGGHIFQNRDAVITAIENNDYEAWLTAEGENSPFRDVISSENFSKFSEMHNLMKAGDREGAEKIREELGFGVRGFGQKEGMKGERKNKNHEAIKNAIEINDFNAWINAHPDNCPNADKLTQENFTKLVEAYNLEKMGDIEGANEIRKEINLGEGKFKRGGRAMGK